MRAFNSILLSISSASPCCTEACVVVPGLMSLDMTQMEVLRRSGTPKEQKYAKKILPLLQNSHFLLVTLLFNNALAMEVMLC